jgi:hypothetical protein
MTGRYVDDPEYLVEVLGDRILSGFVLGAVGETLELIGAEEDRIYAEDAEEEPHREVAELALRPLLEMGVQLRVVLVLGALHEPQHGARNVALRNLRDSNTSSVSHEFVGDAAANGVEQEAEVSVFQHAAVASGSEPLEVRGVLVAHLCGFYPDPP